MANPSKQKGTRKERQVVELAQESGFPDAHRLVLKGAEDEGDIGGVDDMTIEVKYRGPGKKLNISGAVDEAKEEAENAGTKWYIAAVHRANKNVRDTYAVRPLEDELAKHREHMDLKAEVKRLRRLARAADAWVDDPASAPLRRNLRRAAIAVDLADQARRPTETAP